MKIIDAPEPPQVETVETPPVVAPPPVVENTEGRAFRDTLRGIAEQQRVALKEITSAVNQKMHPEFHVEMPPVEMPERKACAYRCKVKNHQTGAEYTMTFQPITE